MSRTPLVMLLFVSLMVGCGSDDEDTVERTPRPRT